MTQFLATFKEFPPRQKAASFTIDQVVEKLEAVASTAGTRRCLSLPSWNDGADEGRDRRLRRACDREGGRTTSPPAERVAVFDNDGTLWCEKPMPIELGFLLKRMAEMAAG